MILELPDSTIDAAGVAYRIAVILHNLHPAENYKAWTEANRLADELGIGMEMRDRYLRESEIERGIHAAAAVSV